MISSYYKLICTHQSVQNNRMNPKSNRVNNSNCFNNKKKLSRLYIEKRYF